MNSLNRGNFLEIFKLAASHDEVVSERLMYRPKNALYTCPSIQNDLLKLMGIMVQSIVCCKVPEAGLFSILVDETKDISKKEQITFVLRCIDPKEGTVNKPLLKLLFLMLKA